MANKKYKKKRKDNFPAELAELNKPKKAEIEKIGTSKFNLSYMFRDNEWEF